MMPIPLPDRSRLLRFPEGTLLNHKYVLVSPPAAMAAAAAPAGHAVPLRAAKEPARPKPQYVAPLGRGGSSVVFLASQVLFAHQVRLPAMPCSVLRAVKFYLLSPELLRRNRLQEPQTANTQNVLNEIKNLTRVDHANILKVIDAGVCERAGLPVHYLVTDYVPGPTLREVIACRRSRHRAPYGELVYRRLRADPTLIVRILDQLAAAVEYLHEQNIYHCDIAPKNIFLHLGAGCRPVLGDFTLGRQLGDWDVYDRILIGGAMRYAPLPVHRYFRRNENPREFAADAAYWDIYGFAKSARELLALAPGETYLPWKNDLMRCLGEALHPQSGVTAAALHQRIANLL